MQQPARLRYPLSPTAVTPLPGAFLAKNIRDAGPQRRRNRSNRHTAGGQKVTGGPGDRFRKLLAPIAELSFKPPSGGILPPPISFNLSKFERVGDCLVYSPATRPTAVIHFVGGSFIGAAPDLFYGYLIKLLVERGFLVVATLFDVTFDYVAMAATVQGRFSSCLELLCQRGLPSAGLPPGEVSELPVFAAGHSMGALVIALIATQEGLASSFGAPQGNIVISYTNRRVSYVAQNADQMGPALAQLRGALQTGLASAPGILLAAAEQVLEAVERSSSSLQEYINPSAEEPLLRFAHAFTPIVSDVLDGRPDYFPSPEENLERISRSYSVPTSLLIQCTGDPIEDSPALEAALRKRVTDAGEPLIRVQRAVVPGTHFTPLAQDPTWSVGDVFSPTDAAAAAAKSAALSDIRNLVRVAANWVEDEIKYQ